MPLFSGLPASAIAAASAAPQGADKPAAEPETEAAPEIPVYDRYAAEPSPRKSARPSDEEVRAFLDAFKRGDFLDLTEQEVSEPPIRTDERFYMGGERKNKREYNGVEVDTSADESYRAPAAESFIASYAAEDGGDAEEPDQPSGAFGRMGAKLSGVLGRRGSSCFLTFRNLVAGIADITDGRQNGNNCAVFIELSE